jgi:hypothetical protein
MARVRIVGHFGSFQAFKVLYNLFVDFTGGWGGWETGAQKEEEHGFPGDAGGIYPVGLDVPSSHSVSKNLIENLV